MRTNTLFLFLISLFSSCSSSNFTQQVTYKQPIISFTDKVDSLVAVKMNQYNIPGLAIGIVKDDSILYTRGYGVNSLKSQELITANTIFHTGSVSKIFTALAVMNLVKDGRLSLDDKLVDVVPNLNFNDKRIQDITIKNLLNHTSGIPDVMFYNWSKNNQADATLKNYIRNKKLKVEFAPSTNYKYSNLAYDILGYIVEVSSGQLFEDYVQESIFRPTGMYNSDFRFFQIPDSSRSYPHSKNWFSKNVYQRKTYPYTREHAPSSTLNSSAHELSLWMLSFIQVIKNETEPYIFNSMIEESTDLNKNIGLGFQLYKVGGKKAFGHYGGDKGFRSYLVISPEDGMGLVILANCDYNEDFRQEILHAIIKSM